MSRNVYAHVTTVYTNVNRSKRLIAKLSKDKFSKAKVKALNILFKSSFLNQAALKLEETVFDDVIAKGLKGKDPLYVWRIFQRGPHDSHSLIPLYSAQMVSMYLCLSLLRTINTGRYKSATWSV